MLKCSSKKLSFTHLRVLSLKEEDTRSLQQFIAVDKSQWMSMEGIQPRLVKMPLVGMDIWKCCSGQEPADVHGVYETVGPQQRMGIWMCYSGQGPMDVLNMFGTL